MPNYTLEVNGERKVVSAPEDMPLLWVLRDLLKITGPKYGCGIAQCRACTVLLDGVESVSCKLAIADVGPRKITTIEGLSKLRDESQAAGATMHAVQESWAQESVPQCGYCQPGQILTAYALLRRNPKPKDADIDAAMSGNICRCGTYNRIRKAVHRAAQSMGGADKEGN